MLRTLPFFSIITFLFLGACSTHKSVSSAEADRSGSKTDYRVIYYIHGDLDYLYHDREGTAKQADREALNRAIKTAEVADSGEVFIFHHNSQRKFLGLFPRRSNRLYHYINGELINEVKYRPGEKDEAFLTTERSLFSSHKMRESEKDKRNIFLFFGHEIPSGSNQIYHSSFPKISVSTASFSDGLMHFNTSGEKFDLTVLSTCSNGSPEMAEKLSSVTNVLLASPQNLHLSHIRPEKLSILESNPGVTAAEIAEAIAEDTYRELSSSVQTVITLSIYRLEDIQAYLNELTNLITEYTETQQPNVYRDNTDCADLGLLDDGEFNNGIKTYFRPPAFGRESGRSTHSGWGCKPTD